MKTPQDPNWGQQTIRRMLDEAFARHSAGNSDQAEAMLHDVLAKFPNEIEAFVGLGIIADQTGRRDLAITRMRAALALDPRCIQAHSWLALLLIDENQIQEAGRHAERAVTLDPNNLLANTALARCSARVGDLRTALPRYRQAIQLNPKDAELMYEYSELLARSGNALESGQVLKRALTLAPNVPGYLRLASLELGRGRIEEAARFGRKALELEPDSAAGHLILGRILTEQLNSEEAAFHWRRAAELQPNGGAVSLEKGLALNTIGQFDEAILELRSSIESNPNQGTAYQSLVYAKRIVEEDRPLLDQMERLAATSTLPAAERLKLLYSLGKGYDDLGDYERAMRFFDSAKSLAAESGGSRPFDVAAFRAATDAKMKLFTRRFFANWNGGRLEGSLPLFVMGMMRSGTTLAEQILTCHPSVGTAGEETYWSHHEAQFVDYQALAVNPSNLRWCANEYFNVLRALAPGRPHVIDKNPLNAFFVGSIHLAFPNARLIRTQRNAIDTALSIWATPMSADAAFTADKRSIVEATKQYVRLMAHWREVIPPDRLLEIRYEDLVSSLEPTAKKMTEFCGLGWDEACLHPERNDRRIVNPSFWQARQPIYRTSTERWRKYEPWLGPFAELQNLE